MLIGENDCSNNKTLSSDNASCQFPCQDVGGREDDTEKQEAEKNHKEQIPNTRSSDDQSKSKISKQEEETVCFRLACGVRF